MKRPSRKFALAIVAVSLIGAAGVATAASVIAPSAASHQGLVVSLSTLVSNGPFVAPPVAPEAPPAPPSGHGSCGWHHSGDGW